MGGQSGKQTTQTHLGRACYRCCSWTAPYQRALRDGEPSTDFDNRVVFLPGVEENLAHVAGLLRPLVRREWARFVGRCNDDALEDVEACRGPLLELQSGACFYCATPLGGRSEIDHFLPWARCADDGLHNLVVAHVGCNGDKSDHLAAVRHVRAWRQRFREHGCGLAEIARDSELRLEPERSLRLARCLYREHPPGAVLWAARSDFEPYSKAERGRILAELAS